MTGRMLALAALAAAGLAATGAAPRRGSGAMDLRARVRREEPPGSGRWRAEEVRLRWDPRQTAVILCDMWDKHWCSGATARVAEMAPVMNQVVRAARRRGMLIVHAPSETMEHYKDTPQRRRALEAPDAPPPPPSFAIRPPEPPLPIDDSDGGCDSGEKPWHRAWSRQHPAIAIAPEDVLTDSGEEVWRLFRARGIQNVLIMGVHTNMCVLGRPFGIRRLVGLGLNVALVRDMTDSMYNPERPPHVSHFRGTELVVEHIERHWCPSVLSSELTGRPPFTFRASALLQQQPDEAEVVPL